MAQVSFPEEFADLLYQPNIASLATTMTDGSPQVTPVWFSCDGTYLYVNSVVGYLKDRNMRARPQVALLIVDPTNNNRYISMRGLVIAYSDATVGRLHLDQLAQRYMGIPTYPDDQPGDVHVRYTITPVRINTMG
jgi:PPOX class probable F420-dependent enzyme